MSCKTREDVLVERLDCRRELDYYRELVHLVAAQVACLPVLRKYVEDLVAGRVPGGPGSLLAGRSQVALWRARSRLIRVLLESIRLLADSEPRDVQRRSLLRLEAAIASATKPRTSRPVTRAGDQSSPQLFHSIDEALAAWIGVMKELGAANEDFSVPGRRGWLTGVESN